MLPAFDDPEPGMREQALRLSEGLLADPRSALRNPMASLLNDPSPRVRFQLALSTGSVASRVIRAKMLSNLLGENGADPWIRTAALSSAGDCGMALLNEFLPRASALDQPTKAGILTRLAAMIGAGGKADEITGVLNFLGGRNTPAEDAALLTGLGQGMRNSKTPLPAWLANPPKGAEAAVAKLRVRFTVAAVTVRDEARNSPTRVAAAGLLALAPFDVAGPALAEALTPATPGDVQSAAVKALAAHPDPKVSELLLKNWNGYGPTLRREVLDALTARPDRALKLLDAVEKKTVAASELDLARVQQLKTHPNAAVRAKAAAVLKATVNPDRAKVVASYAAALTELVQGARRGSLRGDPPTPPGAGAMSHE